MVALGGSDSLHCFDVNTRTLGAEVPQTDDGGLPDQFDDPYCIFHFASFSLSMTAPVPCRVSLRGTFGLRCER